MIVKNVWCVCFIVLGALVCSCSGQPVDVKSNCITIQEGDVETTTCQWSIYSFITERTYDDDDCKFGCKEQYIVKNSSKIQVRELFTDEDQALKVLGEKFRQEFDVLKNEDEDCFEQTDFYPPGWNDISFSVSEDGLSFFMPLDVPGYCSGPFGETSFFWLFKDLLPLVNAA